MEKKAEWYCSRLIKNVDKIKYYWGYIKLPNLVLGDINRCGLYYN